MLLQPFLNIKVHARPTDGFLGFGAAKEGELIGEHRVSLNEKFPCTWFPGVSLTEPYDTQESRIRQAVKDAVDAAKAKPEFKEQSEIERHKQFRKEHKRR